MVLLLFGRLVPAFFRLFIFAYSDIGAHWLTARASFVIGLSSSEAAGGLWGGGGASRPKPRKNYWPFWRQFGDNQTKLLISLQLI